MVGSKWLNIKLKATPNISIRTQQAAAATPATEENSEDLIEIIRKM